MSQTQADSCITHPLHTTGTSSSVLTDDEVLQHVYGRLESICRDLQAPTLALNQYNCLQQRKIGYPDLYNKLAELEIGVQRLKHDKDPEYDQTRQAIVDVINQITSRCCHRLREKDEASTNALDSQRKTLNEQYVEVLRRLVFEYESKNAYIGHVEIDIHIVDYALQAQRANAKVEELKLKIKALETDNKRLRCEELDSEPPAHEKSRSQHHQDLEPGLFAPAQPRTLPIPILEWDRTLNIQPNRGDRADIQLPYTSIKHRKEIEKRTRRKLSPSSESSDLDLSEIEMLQEEFEAAANRHARKQAQASTANAASFTIGPEDTSVEQIDSDLMREISPTWSSQKKKPPQKKRRRSYAFASQITPEDAQILQSKRVKRPEVQTNVRGAQEQPVNLASSPPTATKCDHFGPSQRDSLKKAVENEEIHVPNTPPHAQRPQYPDRSTLRQGRKQLGPRKGYEGFKLPHRSLYETSVDEDSDEDEVFIRDTYDVKE